MAEYFESCNEISDFNKLISALRKALPENLYPHKEDYTDKQILSLYEPGYGGEENGCKDVADDYGDVQCVCGHNIKYIYFVVLRDDPRVTVEPVGSKCIESFSILFDGACLKKIIELFSLKDLWDGYYTTGDFSAKNGFTKETMTYLDRWLEDYQYNFLSRIVRKRKDVELTRPQIRLMYGIMKRIREIYNEILNSSKPTLY